MRYRLVLIELATDVAASMPNGFLQSDAFMRRTIQYYLKNFRP